LRIIGGQHAGFIIRPPKNLQARPTTDIAKESLFNILTNRLYFEDLAVLDLFAGGGGISLEFASRGAKKVTSIDISPVTSKFITDVKKQLALENLEVVKSDVARFLNSTAETYDLIFADPPYNLPDIIKLKDIIWQRNLLNEGGVFIIEHSSNVKLSPQDLAETRKYGQSSFSFYSRG
jgi:16S rRNA (guanine(966)-N(2))-methyltransferase RsmD